MSTATSTTIPAITGTSTRATTEPNRRRPAASTRPEPPRAVAAALAAVLAWTLFAFGGVYLWSLAVAFAGLLLIALLQRPSLAGAWRTLDAMLVAVLLAAALQLVPLPDGLRSALSPSAADFDARTRIAPPASPYRPLSLAPEAWPWGFGVLAAAVLCFWSSRHATQAHGARLLARMIAWMGLLSSLLVIVEPALFPDGRIYGIWRPLSPMAHPAGPIVSRNHFATWILIALPLTLGYLAAHVRTHWIDRRRRVPILADARALWLMTAGVLMAAALFVTQSRAGIIGFAAAGAFGLSRGWRRSGPFGRLALLLYAAVLAAAVFAWARPDAVMSRFDQALQTGGWGGRPEIWREAIALARRFWLTGTGLGTFDMVMPAYQTATLTVLFNHAHNQYLHSFVEGGLLVTLPLGAAVIAFVRLASRCLREDSTPMVHLREGALAGFVGVAVQSLWETPMLTPAVLLLLAAAAGLALHRPAHVEGRVEEPAD